MPYSIKTALVVCFVFCLEVIVFMIGTIGARTRQSKRDRERLEAFISRLKINEEKRRTNYMSMYSLGYCAAIKDFESVLKECDDL